MLYMARPRRTDRELVRKALGVSQRTQDSHELRQALAVLLPAEMNATLEQTARVLGIGRATVARLQRGFGEHKLSAAPRNIWGGRRRYLMSLPEEREFLEPWEKQAKEGAVLILSQVGAALAQKLGRKVNRSVVWRLLARHGWRKVAPATRHLKSDPHVQ